jgi:hypothetical protein
MGVTVMRFLLIAFAAALLMLPAARQTKACELGAFVAEAQPSTIIAARSVAQEFSAEEKKMADKKPMKKTAKKHTKKKMKKEKVEYMRAVPVK